MGYYLAMGPCHGCKQIFSFNPVRVPSINIDGVRRPICLECVERVNPMRARNGVPLIVPLPGAYDGCEEGELDDGSD